MPLVAFRLPYIYFTENDSYVQVAFCLYVRFQNVMFLIKYISLMVPPTQQQQSTGLRCDLRRPPQPPWWDATRDLGGHWLCVMWRGTCEPNTWCLSVRGSSVCLMYKLDLVWSWTVDLITSNIDDCTGNSGVFKYWTWSKGNSTKISL